MSEERSELERREGGEGALDALPGLVRFAAASWWHTAEWAAENSIRAARRLVGAAYSADSAADLAQEVGEVARGAARDFADVTGLGERVREAVPEGSVAEKVVSAAADVARPRDRNSDAPSLAETGEMLLVKSRDVLYEVDAHPAYERILADMAPDEARILRLLLIEGPQPAADIRTGGPFGLINSRLIAAGFTMIGARAGLRYRDRVPAYLNNLFRMGLIWFSRETLHDHLAYQVLEAQPEVLAATKSIRFPRIVRRSIHLTPFGEDFCRVCFATDDTLVDELPAHSDPDKT